MNKQRKTVKTTKTWRKTRKQGLYQHRNRGFYSRTFHGGKEVWTPHETTVQAVAEAKHAALRKTTRATRGAAEDAKSGNMTFLQALELFKANRLDATARKEPLKPSTIRYQDELFVVILRDWPQPIETPLKRIKHTDCKAWAKTAGEKVGATRFNGALGILRAILNEGIKSGAIISDPSAGIAWKAVPKTKRTLPNRAQFAEIIEAIRTAGGRFSRAAADFVAGLAYTGMRLREAGFAVWADVDLAGGRLHIKGDPDTATKNRETVTVPLNPAALALFQRMKADYPKTKPQDRLFLVREAQRALDRATKKLGCPRITHHSLRSLFATSCIEAGVDIPTISRWLNHKDGGVLLMKTYGKLRDEHSKAEAQKVSFAPALEGAAS